MHYVTLFCLVVIALAAAFLVWSLATLAGVEAEADSPKVFVTDGDHDEVQFDAAWEEAEKTGGPIYLMPGEYIMEAPVPWYRRWEIWTAIALGLSVAVNAHLLFRIRRHIAACLLLFLFAFAATAHAEPFEVWEDNSEIWARDLAVGDPWQISHTGTNSHSPDVDGPYAVWISDWSYAADVMGTRLTQGHGSGQSFESWSFAVQPEIASDPQIGYIGTQEERAFIVWRQSGGIWGRRYGNLAPPPEEVVPSYTGPFGLDGRTLTWEGGSEDLYFPTAIPEPGTWIMLLSAVALFGLWHRRS